MARATAQRVSSPAPLLLRQVLTLSSGGSGGLANTAGQAGATSGTATTGGQGGDPVTGPGAGGSPNGAGGQSQGAGGAGADSDANEGGGGGGGVRVAALATLTVSLIPGDIGRRTRRWWRNGFGRNVLRRWRWRLSPRFDLRHPRRHIQFRRHLTPHYGSLYYRRTLGGYTSSQVHDATRARASVQPCLPAGPALLIGGLDGLMRLSSSRAHGIEGV